MKIYKVRDPSTGLFYTGNMYLVNPTTKLGKAFANLPAAKAMVTRFGFDSRVSHLVKDDTMEIVEFTLSETAVLTLKELKNE
jgi:hypothetical protein